MGQHDIFGLGDSFDYAGMELRIVRGNRRGMALTPPLDLRLEWVASNGLWVPVSMDVIRLISRMFYENEDRLYPPLENPRWDGGEKWWKSIDDATRNPLGVQYQHMKLLIERSRPGKHVHEYQPAPRNDNGGYPHYGPLDE